MLAAGFVLDAQTLESGVLADSTNMSEGLMPVDSVGLQQVRSDAEASIRAIAEYRFTPLPAFINTEAYGVLDSIRADVLDAARRPAVSRGPFGDAEGSAVLAGWDSGAIGAYGSLSHMPGLMGIEEGGLNVVQNFGNLTIGAGVSMSKYAYFGGMRRQTGFHGNAQWRFNDALSLRVFGSYYGRGSFTTAAMSGYMGSSSYGAALRIDASEKWGMDIGAQRVYNVMSGRWETVPIAKPFFKINGKEAIGIDVGGILHELLRSKVGSRGNPTMGPPVPTGYAPVRPREDW